MESVFERVSVSDEIKETLLDVTDNYQTPISMALRANKLLESGCWHLTGRDTLDSKLLDQFYQEAILCPVFFQDI